MARIYHNPRCSTSRKTLELLRDNGIEPEIVLYLNAPPSRAVLAALIADAGIDVRTAVRRKEALYRELRLDVRREVDEPRALSRPDAELGGQRGARVAGSHRYEATRPPGRQNR